MSMHLGALSVGLTLTVAPALAFAQAVSPPPSRAELDSLRARVASLETDRAIEHNRRYEESMRPFGIGSMFVFGLLQTRWTGVIAQGGGDSASPPSSFTLPRARLGIYGNTGMVSYVLSGELGQARGLRVGLADASIDVRHPADWTSPRLFELRIGQFKVPLSHLTQVDEGQRLFVDRPVSLDALGFDRDIGVSIHAFTASKWNHHWGAGATLGAWNGAGANRIDPRYGPLLLARLELAAGVHVEPRVEPGEGPVESRPLDVRMGVTATRQRVPVPAGSAMSPGPAEVGRDGIDLVTFGGDLTARFAGWALEVEGLWRRELWGAEGQRQSPKRKLDEPFRGGVLQLSYDLRWLRRGLTFPSNGLQLGLRTSAAEVSPIITGGLLAPILGDVRIEVGAVARYQWNLPGPELWLRGQYSFFNWTRSDSAQPGGPAEHRFTLELQAAIQDG